MDISHVEFVAVLLRIGRRIEILDAAIGRHLVFVLYDRIREPSVWRVGTTLSQIVGRFSQVPKMIDHAGAHESAPLMIKSNTPRIAGPLAKQIEFLCDWVDAKKRASEVEYSTILFNDRAIENTVETV